MLSGISPTIGLLISAATFTWLVNFVKAKAVKVPIQGKKFWEPRVVANFRFFLNARDVISKGYERFKEKAFMFMRTDGDVVVLAPSFLDELAALPYSVANPTDGHMHNLLGDYTGLNILMTTDLHYRMIRKKLTPNLNPIMDFLNKEIPYGFEQDIPKCDNDWASFNVYHTILKLVARTSARSFVGPDFCRSPEWLEIVTQYTENLFRTVVVTRLFPLWMQPFLIMMIPHYWRGNAYIKRSKRFLAPAFDKRFEAFDNNTYDESYPTEHDTMLAHMISEARGVERDPEKLCHLQVVLALASIHTVQLTIVHIFYDLVAHPEWFEPLRDEIRTVYAADGHRWNRASYGKLQKLDSFMRESQRISPPALLSFHRIMHQEFVLSDGTILPKGTHICMATNAIQNDPAVTPDPEAFEPMRYYELRKRPGEENKHQFSNADRTALNFGHGKNACPGRFFASLEIKMLLTRLLMEYDVKLPKGKGRPANFTAHEFLVPDMNVHVLCRKRRSNSVVPQDEPF